MKPGRNNKDEPFPWRDGQRFRLLIDGFRFFPVMLQAIDAANSHVLIEMYLMESGQIADQFIESLLRAAKRGIYVHLLLDDFGSRGLSKRDRQRLTDGMIELTFYNPLHFDLFGKKLKNNLFRNHRKFMIVDGHVAFTGGMGITDSFTGDTAWHDCMLQISGPVSADWQALFNRDIQRWTEHVNIPAARVTEYQGGAAGRLVCTSGGTRLPLKKVLLNRIRNGRRRTWLASAYFIPSRKIRRALRRAAVQGTDVRLLLPGPVTDHPAVRHASRRYYARLLRHGVRIFEYQKRFMHTKTVLVDDWCTIGSSNMDRWGFRWNLEANQEADDLALAVEVQNMLLNDYGCSKEIHYNLWRQRSWSLRWKEWLWGKIDLWIAR